MHPINFKIELFDTQKHSLSKPVQTAYLAKLFAFRVKRFCPGDGEFKKTQPFDSWEENMLTTNALAGMKARFGDLISQGAEVTIEAVPAIALGNQHATLLVVDVEKYGEGIPEFSLNGTLGDVALRIHERRSRSTTMAWVTKPGFPPAEMPFVSEQVMGKISAKYGDRNVRSRPIKMEYTLDGYISILARCLRELQKNGG